MSIASEITRISGKVSDSFDAVVAKGGTVTSRKIADLPTAIGTISGGGEWQPDPDWWDIETILKNDTETYDGKAIILYPNSDDTTTFTISGSVVAVKTSDGSFYTSTTTHTWDRTKDKPASGDTGDTTPKFATRYVIIYLNTDTPELSAFNNFKAGNMYIIFGCNVSATSFGSGTFFYNNSTLIAFNFLDGYKLQGGTSFTFFCYQCYSLQELPDVLDVSHGTSFASFCNGCCSLRKLPDVLDVSSGTDFSNFCNGCSALQKLPDVLDVSHGTSFNSFCWDCYSLRKLPDVLDVSSGRDFGRFCNSCYSLRELPDVLDVSSGTSFASFCSVCYALVKANIKLGNVSVTTLKNSTLINIESLKYIADNAPTVSGLTLTIGATNITRAGGASGEIITTLTNKGWTVN